MEMAKQDFIGMSDPERSIRVPVKAERRCPFQGTHRPKRAIQYDDFYLMAEYYRDRETGNRK
jgi:hypothetical protein